MRDVRQYIRKITRFKSVTIEKMEPNFGLAHSIIDGVTSVVNQYRLVIVLEDALATTIYLLVYMNEAPNRFTNNKLIVSICTEYKLQRHS